MPEKSIRFAVPILAVNDLTRAIAFYSLLGFAASRYEDGDTYAFLTREGFEIHIARTDTLLHGEGHGTGRGVYFYLAEGAAGALEAEFRAAGANILWPLAPREWKMKEFVLSDPDGNLLRFGEPGSDQLQLREIGAIILCLQLKYSVTYLPNRILLGWSKDRPRRISMVKKLISAFCISAAFTLSANAADLAKLDARIEAAHEVLHELMGTPDKGIPEGIAEKATCVAVVPGFKKGAFVVGAQYGQGVVSCRTGHGWSAPAFIQMTGASFGFQIGGQSTDLVLVAMSHDGFQRLLHDKVKLGGDASVAAGPVGRNSQASTTELANAGFLSYSRNKGIFAGVDLTGDVVNQNHEDTETYYGKDATYESILTGGVHAHASSAHFVRTVSELFHSNAKATGK